MRNPLSTAAPIRRLWRSVTACLAATVLISSAHYVFAETDPSTGIAIYPGATKLLDNQFPPGLCGGHTVTGTTYLVKAVPIATIVSWYRKAIPDATFFVVVPIPAESATTATANIFLAPGNAQSVRVRQTVSTVAVAAAMPELSVVAIDVNRYSPAVTTDLLKASACRLY
jgi:hypothetical protein